ncbi:MAG: hypothetical protein ABIM96_04560 [Candidatus Saccharimonas sp.]
MKTKETTPTHMNEQTRTHIREIVPNATDLTNDVSSACLEDILADPILSDIPAEEQFEAVSDAFELYAKSKDIVAPVITGFADSLLREAEGLSQIVFAARDGLGAYEAAKLLLSKFPKEYDVEDGDMAYAYLTRKLVYGSSHEDLRQYLAELGIDPQKPTLLADIGMYGSIMHTMQGVMPQVEARYLISRNQSIPGYADDYHNTTRMNSLATIVGNPATHFLEDTFSGCTNSPDKLVEKNGKLVPNIDENAFEPKELLKRKYAMRAFTDYVQSLDTPPSKSEKRSRVRALDSFLSDPGQYQHLMVPHVRG